MILNFSDSNVILNKENSIFLAGPTLRDSSFEKSWRKEAVKILEKLEYSGVVYIPEYSSRNSFDSKYIEKQTRWEWKALNNAKVILFWIPRDKEILPGFTTNIEFGRYITKKPKQIVLGYPENACKMQYLKLLYKEETSKEPTNNLEDTIKEALKIIKEDL